MKTTVSWNSCFDYQEDHKFACLPGAKFLVLNRYHLMLVMKKYKIFYLRKISCTESLSFNARYGKVQNILLTCRIEMLILLDNQDKNTKLMKLAKRWYF